MLTSEKFYKSAKILVIVALSSIIMSACASQPEELQAQHVSEIRYTDWSCKQLSLEAETIDRRVAALHGQLKQKAGDDQAQMAIGLILFWPALFLLEGGDGTQAAEYSRLKGDRDAIERAGRFKNCSSIAPKAQPNSKQANVYERLKELRKMKDQGLLNNSEYEEKKAELIKLL